MKQDLDSLAKEDWDTLFPVELVPHNPAWKNIYKQEAERIIEKLGDQTVVRIEHFGSTSIPDISAKSYIDIIIEIPKEQIFDEVIISGLNKLGYHYFRQTGNMADYMVFVKGYNLHGRKEQIYHIHMCSQENEMWHQLIFRDFLMANPKRAKEYEQLKQKLASKYKNDRVGYRMAKSEFISETLEMANETASH
jgi:GrpB-like predicted nucleotidyltransferase (UPF0157 family)